jgi:Ca-activated chloride channel homolog
MNILFPSIEWGASNHWYYFPLVGIAIMLLLYRLIRMNRVRKQLAGTKQAKNFLSNCSFPKTIIKIVLIIVAFISLFMAFLRPMWNKKEEIVEQVGRDLFIALDISRSMLATDCNPDRLTCAKEKIKKLLPMLSCERVGLILFSGSSIVQCPLTTDYAAFLMFLDQIDAETISLGTTALDAAIGKAMDSFNAMPDKKNKLLVIFTDGEDFSSNLSDIKSKAISQGLHIFTMGVGTPEGAPIPLYDIYGKQIGHQKDSQGNIVISRLNEGILKAVAHDSGSIYLRLTSDQSDLNQLVNAITGFEKEKLEDKKLAMLEDQYHYFLLVSFACLLFEWIL